MAKQLLITSAGLTAERAYQLGLVNVVTEPGDAVDQALALAADICRSAPVAVRQTLAAIASQFSEADDRGWDATARAIEVVKASEDMSEGVTAFFERRPRNGVGGDRGRGTGQACFRALIPEALHSSQ
ncbi:enoyl-CoA hydratase-related protein [Rhodococcus sp. NPDC003318]|uniref:enoyl-CoA hydratase-related protein n=1 Tax=Rhodococcus sp. NPDC003318 TaxID=3364503 RepID=UPI0036906BFE